MLFMCNSFPKVEEPANVKEKRELFRKWIETKKKELKVIHFYPKVGRGSVVIFDVVSNEELHLFLTEWMNIIPCSFDIIPILQE